jgi:hypothetical protein
VERCVAEAGAPVTGPATLRNPRKG